MKAGYYWAIRKGQTEEEVIYVYQDSEGVMAASSHKYDRPVIANLFKILEPISARLTPIALTRIKANTYYWAEITSNPVKREVVYIGKFKAVFAFGSPEGLDLSEYKFFKEVKETEE